MWGCWGPNEVACPGFVEVREPKWYDLAGEAVEMETKGRNASGEIASTGAIQLRWRCFFFFHNLVLPSDLSSCFCTRQLAPPAPTCSLARLSVSMAGPQTTRVFGTAGGQGQSLHCILAWQAMISLTANPFGLFFPD